MPVVKISGELCRRIESLGEHPQAFVREAAARELGVREERMRQQRTGVGHRSSVDPEEEYEEQEEPEEEDRVDFGVGIKLQSDARSEVKNWLSHREIRLSVREVSSKPWCRRPCHYKPNRFGRSTRFCAIEDFLSPDEPTPLFEVGFLLPFETDRGKVVWIPLSKKWGRLLLEAYGMTSL